MYESFWQLDAKPFDTGCDPRYFFPGEVHQAALLKLRYAIENRRGAAMLTGASGLGKTLLVELLKSTLADSIAPIVHLVLPRMGADELLAYLADEFQDSPLGDGTPGMHRSLRRIRDFLAGNAEAGRHAAVVVDEAHTIDDPAMLDVLRMLLNFEHQGRPALTLLLVGQTGLMTAVERTPQLEERLDVTCLLYPLGRVETAAYVAHRLRAAGAVKGIFSEEALDTLFELSVGAPRRINRLCDLALLVGYAEELDTNTPSHLQSVQRELVGVGCE
ncbi:MAG: ExeA family protein [Thermoguttaceae bacterium]